MTIKEEWVQLDQRQPTGAQPPFIKEQQTPTVGLGACCSHCPGLMLQLTSEYQYSTRLLAIAGC